MSLAELAIGADAIHCPGCGDELPFRVLTDPTGFYVGTACETCGPYTRETRTFRGRTMAEWFLRELQSLPPGEGVSIPEGPTHKEPLP